MTGSQVAELARSSRQKQVRSDPWRGPFASHACPREAKTCAAVGSCIVGSNVPWSRREQGESSGTPERLLRVASPSECVNSIRRGTHTSLGCGGTLLCMTVWCPMVCLVAGRSCILPEQQSLHYDLASSWRHPLHSTVHSSMRHVVGTARRLQAAAQGGRTQAGAQRLRSAEGGALKGTFDEQTWSTLVELGAAPTPVHGQIGCYKTPRELKPSAATPPLIHSAAGLPGKQTPCSGPPPATGQLAAAPEAPCTNALACENSLLPGSTSQDCPAAFTDACDRPLCWRGMPAAPAADHTANVPLHLVKRLKYPALGMSRL